MFSFFAFKPRLEFPLFQQVTLILDILGSRSITLIVTYSKTDWLHPQLVNSLPHPQQTPENM